MKFSLGELLAKKGLISKQAVDRIEGEREVEAMNAATTPRKKRFSVMDLKSAKDVHDFSLMAKTILLNDFSTVGDIIQEAHRFKENKGFIWRMYQVRDRFPRCPPDKRERFLDRAFRRHDPVVEIPE